MEIVLAESAGFCFGVRRAVDAVYQRLEEHAAGQTGEPIYTYGPIIHNEQVVSDLHQRGVRVIDESDQLSKLPQGDVIIRSHGVSREEEERIRKAGMTITDMTCPFVKKIHRLVEEKSRETDYQIVIAGDPAHPEVQGIIGWSHRPVTVIKNPQEIEEIKLDSAKPVFLVAQTTFHYTKFQNIVDLFQKKGYNINCANTICNATRNRQEEAARLASSVDTMVVIGGSHSSNTQKLFEICKKECNNTHYIQTAEDLEERWFLTADKVGVTGGASTPNTIIEEVINHVRRIRTIIK